MSKSLPEAKEIYYLPLPEELHWVLLKDGVLVVNEECREGCD